MDRLLSSLLTVGFLGASLLAACDGLKSEDEGLEREDLGTVTTDTGGGADVTFEVPPDAVSSLVYCGPYGYDLLATAETITDPSGATIYDMNDPAATAARVGVLDDMLPVLLPVSPDLDVSSGTYGLRVYVDSDSAASLSCSAVYRTQPVETAPSVDLHLVFVDADTVAPGLNAAEGEGTMTDVLDDLAEYWSTLGLTIGDVTYEDFSGDASAYSVVDVDDAEQFGKLLRTVSTDNDRAITYFFVQDITDAGGAVVLGLSGGPPGTAAVGGTSKSGVVVNAASFSSSPDEIARIMAHEGGHFLGLFHTTEKGGGTYDPLSDTPECTTDDDGNGTFSSTECEGTGAENLMWWATNAGATASADQAWVVARSAAVR
jgi:hypothetical protein